jgi:hypothetical protein
MWRRQGRTGRNEAEAARGNLRTGQNHASWTGSMIFLIVVLIGGFEHSDFCLVNALLGEAAHIHTQTPRSDKQSTRAVKKRGSAAHFSLV